MPLAKAYRIETERLMIRCYHPRDARLLKTSIDESLVHLRPWMPWAQHEPESLPRKVARLRKYRGQFDLGQDYTFGIFDKAETTLIGSTGLHTRAGERAREIGYWLNVHQVKQGYALEASQALTKVGFEIEALDRIEIHCAPNNLRSQRIPQKLGYINEARLPHRTLDASGQKADIMIWTMVRAAYFDSPLPSLPIKAFDVLDEPITFNKP